MRTNALINRESAHLRHPPLLNWIPQECAFFFFMLLAGSAAAWDISGHMIVAQVAYTRLNTNAAAHVAQLASQIEFKGHHFNAVNVAGWADDIKHTPGVPHGGEYVNWHFIDLGCPPSHFDLLTNPPPLTIVDGDIVSALKRCQAVVRGHPDPLITDEGVAIALIVHLTGDIHQPLHCSSHYYTPGPSHPNGGHDRGGNAIAVSNFSDTYTNLHSFWDKAYKAKRSLLKPTITTEKDLDTFLTTPNDPNVIAWAMTVLNSAPPASVSLKADFEAWARETRELGSTDAYGWLPGNIETTPRKLSNTYVKKARKLTQQQLCLAGFRLAALLNELYPEH